MREIMASVRPNWFQGAEHLLEIYCRSVASERFLAEQVKATEPNTKRFAALVRLQRAEAMLAANLAGKLRLTPRSTGPLHPQACVDVAEAVGPGPRPRI
jgi:hypothetical protein